MGHRLLTEEELAAALAQIHKRINRTSFKIAMVVTGVLLVGASGGYLMVQGLRAKLAYTEHKLEKTEAALSEARERQKNIEKAMAVSIDARKLGRPVRLTGEMIVVFAGKEER